MTRSVMIGFASIYSRVERTEQRFIAPLSRPPNMHIPHTRTMFPPQFLLSSSHTCSAQQYFEPGTAYTSLHGGCHCVEILLGSPRHDSSRSPQGHDHTAAHLPKNRSYPHLSRELTNSDVQSPSVELVCTEPGCLRNQLLEGGIQSWCSRDCLRLQS